MAQSDASCLDRGSGLARCPEMGAVGAIPAWEIFIGLHAIITRSAASNTTLRHYPLPRRCKLHFPPRKISLPMTYRELKLGLEKVASVGHAETRTQDEGALRCIVGRPLACAPGVDHCLQIELPPRPVLPCNSSCWPGR